ncbi:hypothetical protein Tco_1542934, partial [Tanacetum coccineum]
IYIWVCLVVDDNIFNLVDLHMGMLGGGWKWYAWWWMRNGKIFNLVDLHMGMLGGG